MIDINPTEFSGGGGKYLNAKWLKTIPKMACKVRIISGGTRKVPSYDDKNKLETEAFLNVESTTGLFEGQMDMPLRPVNMNILLSGLSREPNSWAGREIGVFFDPTVKVGADVKGGLRVKVFEADPFATPPPVAATPIEDSIPF